MEFRLRRSLAPLLIVLASGCSDSAPTPPDTYVPPLAITTEPQGLQVPRTLQISATGEGATIAWESSDQTVATVSTTGLVTGRFPGSVTITARRGSQSAAVALAVTARRLEVGPNGASVGVGGTALLTAIVRDADDQVIDGVQVNWRTENASVATVDASTGVATGVATGITGIIATGAGVDARVRLTVKTPEFPLAGIAFSSISTVGNYACGLEALTGRAFCWGDNHSGALGIGEVDGPDAAVLVTGGRRYSSLSVGYYGNCAVEAQTGSAYCWGGNRFGQVGDDTFTTRWVPTLVGGGTPRFSSVSASGDVSCGIEDGTGFAYCWGKGQGDAALMTQSRPTMVGGNPIGFSSISVGSHVCGVEAVTGYGYCWGPNESGQLGDGTTTGRLAPTRVADGRLRFSAISVGDGATCGVEAETGRAYCWGANAYGQLGDGTTTARAVPAAIAGAVRFATISSRGFLTCGLEAQTGVAYCWGHGYYGPSRLVPTIIGSGGVRFSSIGVGGEGCGVEVQTGSGYCWNDSLIPIPLGP
jgi:hypothetical protein